MGCERSRILGLLLALKRELECEKDRQLLDIYIQRIEELLAEHSVKDLFTL